MCFVGQHKSLGQLGGGWPLCQKEAWTHELCLNIHQRQWIINSIRVIVCEFFLCDLCGSYFTERKFCWIVPVRTALCLSYIHSFSYSSVLLAAFLSDTKDRGPPVQSQTWRSSEKMPYGQAHSLRAFEKPPLVQTQALRDFEKVRPVCGSF